MTNGNDKMSESEASWRIRRYKEQQKGRGHDILRKGRKVIGQMGTLGVKAIKTSGSVIRTVAKETRPLMSQGTGYSKRVSSNMRSSPLFAGSGGWGSFDRPARKPHKRGGSRTITIRVVGGQVRGTKKRSKRKRKSREPFSLF